MTEPHTTAEDYAERLRRAGLTSHVDDLMDLALTSIRLRSDPVEEAAAPLGGSRLGGHPDLPDSFPWPSFNGLPQSFVAQINLAEVHPFDTDQLLPSAGLLTFFYDSEQQVWGFDPVDKGGWLVAYLPPETELVRRAFPPSLSKAGIFNSVNLCPETELMLAPWESLAVKRLGLTRDNFDAYADIVDNESDKHRGPRHRLLGHPDPIQGDMQLECQLVHHGLPAGNPENYLDQRVEGLRATATDWQLLLQIDTDDGANIMWGDVGTIYFWITRQDLAARAWRQCHLCLQCF